MYPQTKAHYDKLRGEVRELKLAHNVKFERLDKGLYSVLQGHAQIDTITRKMHGSYAFWEVASQGFEYYSLLDAKRAVLYSLAAA